MDQALRSQLQRAGALGFQVEDEEARAPSAVTSGEQQGLAMRRELHPPHEGQPGRQGDAPARPQRVQGHRALAAPLILGSDLGEIGQPLAIGSEDREQAVALGSLGGHGHRRRQRGLGLRFPRLQVKARDSLALPVENLSLASGAHQKSPGHRLREAARRSRGPAFFDGYRPDGLRSATVADEPDRPAIMRPDGRLVVCGAGQQAALARAVSPENIQIALLDIGLGKIVVDDEPAVRGKIHPLRIDPVQRAQDLHLPAIDFDQGDLARVVFPEE